MLPRSTGSRMARGGQRQARGRTVEIQRLIGRSLRAAVDLSALGEHTVTCDVIQADGGTRTAAITGACVALADALDTLVNDGTLKQSPLKRLIASVSVGIVAGTPVLDLDYPEDSTADTDMNIIMGDDGGIIEIQGTAEGEPFSEQNLARCSAWLKKASRHCASAVTGNPEWFTKWQNPLRVYLNIVINDDGGGRE